MFSWVDSSKKYNESCSDFLRKVYFDSENRKLYFACCFHLFCLSARVRVIRIYVYYRYIDTLKCCYISHKKLSF